MIDTDKYEGHTPAPWKQVKPKDGNPRITTQFCGDEIIVNTGETSWEADMNLIADTPRILQAYKRLREQIVDMIDSMDNYYIRDIQHATDFLRDMIGYYEDEEE